MFKNFLLWFGNSGKIKNESKPTENALTQSIFLSQGDFFSNLRSLLIEPPSGKVWNKLLLLFEKCPPDLFSLAKSYVQEHIEGYQYLLSEPFDAQNQKIIILDCISDDQSFRFLHRYLKKSLRCSVNKIKHDSWGMEWWDFTHEGVEFSIEILYPGSELFVREEVVENKEHNEKKLQDLGEKIAKEYDLKYPIIDTLQMN